MPEIGLDQLSRLIGNIEANQTALRREVDDGFRRLSDTLDAMRNSYHDLNNKAMVEIGKLEIEVAKRIDGVEQEHRSKIASIDTRLSGIEVLLSNHKGYRTANHVWVSAVTAFAVNAAAIAVEWWRR
ncbi:MAG: hypothetical protein KGL26_03085 [Pseudomonadota bacterium]|nr:hypothetical protein [Pseudomonadota bacterium]